MTLTYADIAEIIKLIDASSCEEITLDLGDFKLSMRRKGAGEARGDDDDARTIT